jgi:pyrophosphatase PpaX
VGRRLGIVTAKRRDTVALAFETLPELEEYFDVIVGAEDTERHKPYPDPLLHALAHLDADAGEAAYVGDSPFDIAAARAAGIFSVAVTWGGIHPEARLRESGPDAVVHDAEELLDVL